MSLDQRQNVKLSYNCTVWVSKSCRSISAKTLNCHMTVLYGSLNRGTRLIRYIYCLKMEAIENISVVFSFGSTSDDSSVSV